MIDVKAATMTKPFGAHTLHSHHSHCVWDNALAPALTVAPGDTVTFDCRDASNGQITAESTVHVLANFDMEKVNPVTGPVFIDGAEQGDALKVVVQNFAPSGWGWTALFPGFGLLADDFKNPRLHVWTYDNSLNQPAMFNQHAHVPLKPFTGTIGVAPGDPGTHSIIPPRNVGGNIDTRDIAAGTELILPVEVSGALFSVGDTHAAQGDGEVCGTAIESPMTVTLSFDVIKNAAPPAPQFTTRGPVTRHLDQAGYIVCTGVGPDLMQAAKDACSAMIDRLTAEHSLAPEDAYMLMSVCGDLRITEIVDMPNWVVAFYFPRVVFG